MLRTYRCVLVGVGACCVCHGRGVRGAAGCRPTQRRGACICCIPVHSLKRGDDAELDKGCYYSQQFPQLVSAAAVIHSVIHCFTPCDGGSGASRDGTASSAARIAVAHILRQLSFSLGSVALQGIALQGIALRRAADVLYAARCPCRAGCRVPPPIWWALRAQRVWRSLWGRPSQLAQRR